MYSRSEYFKSAISVRLRHQLDSQLSDAPSDFDITTDVWAKTVYEVCARFKRADQAGRISLLEGLRAIWAARVATFMKQTASMSDEEAEQKVEDDAARFEEMKNELVTTY